MVTHQFNRRNFLKSMMISSGVALIETLMPMRLAFAKTPNQKRLLVVILRGAMDGLAAVPPVGDVHYVQARGSMALAQNSDSLINLDGYFALHRAMEAMMPLYDSKQMLIYHASALPYRDRSHFDAQDLLENGSDRPHAMHSGWLNRLIGLIGSQNDAMAIGSSLPLVMQGPTPVGSWTPSRLPDVDDDFLNRVMEMYQTDSILLKAFNAAQQLPNSGVDMSSGRQNANSFIQMMEKAAQFMLPSTGAHIVTVELGGWDTHANQGLNQGRLANNLRTLATGIDRFKQTLGATWQQTAVLCLTEFGRTVKGNGTGGTDHGTASVAFLLGGSVNGGKVIGDWPGLNRLYEGRDLYPANDLRALIKSTIQQHYALSPEQIDRSVFPNSQKVWLKEKLFV